MMVIVHVMHGGQVENWRHLSIHRHWRHVAHWCRHRWQMLWEVQDTGCCHFYSWRMAAHWILGHRTQWTCTRGNWGPWVLHHLHGCWGWLDERQGLWPCHIVTHHGWFWRHLWLGVWYRCQVRRVVVVHVVGVVRLWRRRRRGRPTRLLLWFLRNNLHIFGIYIPIIRPKFSGSFKIRDYIPLPVMWIFLVHQDHVLTNSCAVSEGPLTQPAFIRLVSTVYALMT